MAAIHANVAADTAGRTSTSSSRNGVSHGRGGAGNLGPSSPADELSQQDLVTPTLKSDVYTTGRGGSGNMTKNTDADAARRAQDVVAPPRRESESNTHVGRGGAANIFRPSQEDIERAKRDNAAWESAVAEEESKSKKPAPADRGLAEKGKQWLANKVRKS